MSVKKNRGKNFIDEEVMCLLDLVENHRNILENKKTNSTINDLKTAAWKLIQDQFNRIFPLNGRTADNLMTKYDNVKQQAKKYGVKRKQSEVDTEVNAIFERVLEIINKKVVDGEKCEYEYDNIMLQSSYLHPLYEENNSEDITLLLDPPDTEIDEKPHISPPEQQTINTEEEGKIKQNEAYKFLKVKENYYNLKIKYLEADIALKEQELKEKKEQGSLNLELLKLQIEEHQLLVLEKRRKLQLE